MKKVASGNGLDRLDRRNNQILDDEPPYENKRDRSLPKPNEKLAPTSVICRYQASAAEVFFLKVRIKGVSQWRNLPTKIK